MHSHRATPGLIAGGRVAFGVAPSLRHPASKRAGDGWHPDRARITKAELVRVKSAVVGKTQARQRRAAGESRRLRTNGCRELAPRLVVGMEPEGGFQLLCLACAQVLDQPEDFDEARVTTVSTA